MFARASTGSVRPGVAYLRVAKTTELYRGMKAHYGVSLTCAGRSISRIDGRERVQTAGTLGLAQPGQVHCNLRRDAPGAFQLVSFDAALVDDARAALDHGLRGSLVTDEVDPRDERARPLRRLHEALLSETSDRFALDVAITEALTALTSFLDTGRAPSQALRPSVRRARAFLLEHLAEDVTLDDVAEHARSDKFHLCRAFSRELGLPPYAFLTQARIARARLLLRQGVRPTEVAPLVGFCDQSQMHRHFVRIVGCTPGAYARMC
ncbi:MAG: helix-turn-helix domain-containing protein [Deltaproteobacteria bacterium]|nr:helix-turn-helix domain-containing protein [Deltaproteobacteria bacterium]